LAAPQQVEVVGNTEKQSSEKAGVGGSTPSLATFFSIVATLLINFDQSSAPFSFNT
jgi:hypothetical protein